MSISKYHDFGPLLLPVKEAYSVETVHVNLLLISKNYGFREKTLNFALLIWKGVSTSMTIPFVLETYICVQ